MNNQPIGILDSGFGGLSIWKDVVRELPNESIVYAGDNVNCPYGSRSEQEIYKLARRLVQFLIKHNCKLIVVACNTITVNALAYLRTEFPQVPIVGAVPVVKTAVERSKSGKIGILSTVRTAESKYQKNLIEQFAGGIEVVNIGTDKLGPFIEKGSTGKMVQIILQRELQPFINAGIDTLALGCSHFPFIRKQIEQILGSGVEILDSGAAIARQTRRILENNDILSHNKSPKHYFYTTGSGKQFEKVLSKLTLSSRANRVSAAISI